MKRENFETVKDVAIDLRKLLIDMDRHDNNIIGWKKCLTHCINVLYSVLSKETKAVKMNEEIMCCINEMEKIFERYEKRIKEIENGSR